MSKHLYFSLNHLIVCPRGIKAITVASLRSGNLTHLYSSVGSWKTLESISFQVFVLNVAECKAKTLKRGAGQPRAVSR